LKEPIIYIINGPNLNLLGTREPEKYGSSTLYEVNENIKTIFPEIKFSFFQTNSETEFIELLHHANKNADGIIINAAAFSHTSIAIADTVASI
jgi:3-dehydroquinate dehydratase-2